MVAGERDALSCDGGSDGAGMEKGNCKSRLEEMVKKMWPDTWSAWWGGVYVAQEMGHTWMMHYPDKRKANMGMTSKTRDIWATYLKHY